METIEEVIDRLRGTCNEPFNIEEYSLEELEILDNVIFECARCGWWCEIEELSEHCDDEMYCTDHNDEEKE